MVLPVPNDTPVTTVDISTDGWSWKAIDQAYFPKPPTSPAFGGFAFGGSTVSKGKRTLEVKACGGYLVSYSPTLEDLARIDEAVFTLPADIQQVLQEHYGKGFGFVVCKFQKGKTDGHPIAYTHSPLKDGRLFIPTRHEHGSAAQKQNGLVVHQGVRCDGCLEDNITGTRWKCQGCPDFDFCDGCFQRDTMHRRKHMFTMMDQPVDRYETDQRNLDFGFHTFENNSSWSLPKQRRGRHDHLDFDHTLYLFNSLLLASPFLVTDSRHAERPSLTTVNLRFLSRFFPNLHCAQRVEIKAEDAHGLGHRIVNGDYYAAHVEK